MSYQPPTSDTGPERLRPADVERQIRYTINGIASRGNNNALRAVDFQYPDLLELLRQAASIQPRDLATVANVAMRASAAAAEKPQQPPQAPEQTAEERSKSDAVSAAQAKVAASFGERHV